MNLPRIPLLAAVTALALVIPATLTWSQAPELDNTLINLPCGVLPNSFACLQAAIKEPTPNQEIIISNATTPIPFRGVAERESRVFLYILRANGVPLTPEPLIGQAGTDGLFSFDIVANQLGEGSYRAVAFYAASLRDSRADATFFQVTGNPEVPFRLTPVIPSGTSCDTECSRFGVDTSIPGVDLNGRHLYYSAQENNYYWMTETLDETSFDTSQQLVREAAVQALAQKACEAGGLDVIEGVLAGHNLTPLTLSPRNAVVMYDDLFANVAQIVGDLGSDCGEPSTFMEGIDDWFPLFRETRSGSQLRCSDTEGICFRVELVTSSDPLLFFSSDTAVTTTIRVLPRAGTVTATIPPMTDGAWRHVVHPEASTAPLAYHVSLRTPFEAQVGWVLPRRTLESSLATLLLAQGFPAREVEAFIRVEVEPVLTDHPYIAVRLLPARDIEQALPLAIDPAPTQLTRIAFTLAPVPAGTVLPTPSPEQLPRFAEMPGLHVREYAAFVVF